MLFKVAIPKILLKDKPEDQAGIVLIGGFRPGAYRIYRGLHAK
jgi:hypothetical protein